MHRSLEPSLPVLVVPGMKYLRNNELPHVLFPYFGSATVSMSTVLDSCTCTIFPSTLAMNFVVRVTRAFPAPDAALPTGPKKRAIVANVLPFEGEVVYRVRCGNVTAGSDPDTSFDEA